MKTSSFHGRTQIYTGDGKGKTTAALGLALRALGAGLSVLLVQFLKGRPTSELTAIRALPGITVRRFGKPTWVRESLEEHRGPMRRGLQALRAELATGKYRIVIADELCTACSLGLIPENDVLDLIRSRPQACELVLTGRGATTRIRQAADLVTVMKAAKHYYQKNLPARKGIEY